MQAAKISICDENAVAANSDQAKRNHRLHVKSQKDEEGCKAISVLLMPRSHRDPQQARYHASLIIKSRFTIACHTMSMSRLFHKRMAFDGGRWPTTSGLARQADIFSHRRHVSKVPISDMCHFMTRNPTVLELYNSIGSAAN